MSDVLDLAAYIKKMRDVAKEPEVLFTSVYLQLRVRHPSDPATLAELHSLFDAKRPDTMGPTLPANLATQELRDVCTIHATRIGQIYVACLDMRELFDRIAVALTKLEDLSAHVRTETIDSSDRIIFQPLIECMEALWAAEQNAMNEMSAVQSRIFFMARIVRVPSIGNTHDYRFTTFEALALWRHQTIEECKDSVLQEVKAGQDAIIEAYQRRVKHFATRSPKYVVKKPTTLGHVFTAENIRSLDVRAMTATPYRAMITAVGFAQNVITHALKQFYERLPQCKTLTEHLEKLVEAVGADARNDLACARSRAQPAVAGTARVSTILHPFDSNRIPKELMLTFTIGPSAAPATAAAPRERYLRDSLNMNVTQFLNSPNDVNEWKRAPFVTRAQRLTEAHRAEQARRKAERAQRDAAMRAAAAAAEAPIRTDLATHGLSICTPALAAAALTTHGHLICTPALAAADADTKEAEVDPFSFLLDF